MKYCQKCGKEISITRPGAKFCLTCREESRRKVAKPKLTKEKQSFKEMVMRAQGISCAICGWSYPNDKNGCCVVHHIIPVSDGGSSDDIGNGIVLCPNCHARVHKGAFSEAFLVALAKQTIEKQKRVRLQWVNML